jgi:hypothetical protein
MSPSPRELRQRRSSRGSHQGHHPADDLRIVPSAGRLYEMADLAHDLMHRCILRSDPLYRGVEVQSLVKIIRALTARLLMDEVALRRRPWCGEKVLNGREERPRESFERIGIRSSCFDKPSQGTGFLRGDTHSLAERGTESADRIAERQQVIGKTLKRLKALAISCRISVPRSSDTALQRDTAQLSLALPNRISHFSSSGVSHCVCCTRVIRSRSIKGNTVFTNASFSWANSWAQ